MSEEIDKSIQRMTEIMNAASPEERALFVQMIENLVKAKEGMKKGGKK